MGRRKRNLSSLNGRLELSLRIISFNVENLFVSPQATNFQEADNKLPRVIQPGDKDFPLTQLLAKSIKEMSPDILGLMEVGGQESLEAFNEIYLNNSYYPSLIPGNSDRNIHLGYLINKKLPYDFEHYTHRNRSFYPKDSKKEDYLSRDIAELRLFNKEDDKKERPLLIVLTVHLKSKRSDGQDFGGQKKRAAEFKLLLETYIHLEKRFKSEVPIVIMGDFNAVIHHEYGGPGFQKLFDDTDLTDILEILKYPFDERATQTSFSRKGEVIAQQFDYIFLSKKWHSLVNKSTSGLYLFRDKNNQVIRRPQSSFERAQLPSDHYPLICDLELTKI